MTIHAHIIKLLAIVLLATVTTVADAANKAGQILFSRGVVSIVDANDSRRGARTGADVFEGERIVTGRNGIVQLHLTDGTLVGLRGNSDYLIKRQRYGETAEVEESEEEASLADQAGELFSGWMRMVTGAIGKSNPANVQQSTQVATIGIRGTVFQVIHVPEEGLPGFPDTEPGTYLMLEEGEIEISGEGGSRIVRPGEVVFVPFAGAVPRPAPDKRDLFYIADEADAYDSVDAYDGELDLSDLSEEINDTVIERLPTDVLPPFTRLGMISAYGAGSWGGSDGTQLQLAGSGTGRYPTKALADNPEVPAVLEVIPGERPNEQGYYLLTGQGTTPVSEVFWGWFDDTQYTIDSTTAFGNWHYMLASQVLYDVREINNAFPSGQFFYSYVGGSNLLGDFGGVLLVNSGTAEIQLLTMDVFFSLILEDEIGLQTTLDGGGTIGEYVTSGVQVGDGVSLTGTIVGGFAGSGMEGMISTILLLDDSDSQQYSGTALFEQDGGSASGTQLVVQSITYDDFVPPNRYRLFGLFPSEDIITTEGSGEDRIVTNLVLGQGLPKQTIVRLIGSPTGPLENGGVRLKDGSYINWGAWAAGDYEVVYGLGGNTGTGTAEWLWLAGDRYLTESIVNAGGSSYLSGTYSYKLAGSTLLYEVLGGAALTVDGGEMVVDFATTDMFVSLLVNGGFSILDGAGTIGDFYGAGITLADSGFGPYSGTINGAFYGDDAYGAGAYLDINDGSTGQWQGALGFVRGERANEGLLYFADDGFGSLTRDLAAYAGFVTEGEGNDRKVISYDFNNVEVGIELAANPDAVPVNQGYYRLDDRTEINWGIWEAGNYSANASPTSPGGIDWHYTLSDNLILNPTELLDVASSAGLTGSFTYNLVGQTGLSSVGSGVASILPTSTIAVDFGLQSMDFTVNTDNLGTLTNGTLIDFTSFYSGGGFLISDVTGVQGTVGGAFVGTEAQGITSSIQITDDGTSTGVADTYYGNMVFAR